MIEHAEIYPQYLWNDPKAYFLYRLFGKKRGNYKGTVHKTEAPRSGALIINYCRNHKTKPSRPDTYPSGDQILILKGKV